jgi:hypothetical protein
MQLSLYMVSQNITVKLWKMLLEMFNCEKDIFRTNWGDRNISDTSSYLDLAPLYGFNEDMQRKVRDTKYKLGLLKPDTFAEDRLLRQPPGVNIMLVMYNRYHNYVATQLRRINENGRFEVPQEYQKEKQEAVDEFRKSISKEISYENKAKKITDFEKAYDAAWDKLDDDLFGTARL